MPRQYTFLEHQFVTEWVEATYPTATYVGYRVRLGAFDPTLQDLGATEAQLKMLGVRRRWADGIVVDNQVVHLIEGKLTARPGPLEQLRLYKKLFPLTPELEQFKLLPVVLHLVWGVSDPIVEAIAREDGIEVHLFRPPWLDQYLNAIEPKKASATGAAGFGRLPPRAQVIPPPQPT